jgi:RHS repeat-associated protein
VREVAKGRDHYLYYNGHGDLAAEADASGTRTALHTYDPFGAPIDTQPSNQTVHGFTGASGAFDKQTDTTSGLTLMGARPYDPSLGRFLAVDPVDGGSLNNYDYAAQDPVNGYDLAGTRTEAEMSDGGDYYTRLCSTDQGYGGTVTTTCQDTWIVDVGSDATLIVTDTRQKATKHGAVVSQSETPGTSTYESDRTSVGGGLPGSKQHWSTWGCVKKVIGDPGESDSWKGLVKDAWKTAIYDCVVGGMGWPLP